MSEFAVGEIAIYLNPGSVAHNCECTITSELRRRECWVYENGVDRFDGYRDCYRICFAALRADDLLAYPHQLRKRRPPPDWVKLCALDSVKGEKTAEAA